jgi:uncharacterized protein YndB with AHSA1/START domain
MTARTKEPTTISLPSDKEIMMTRVFDAPRQLVFEAHSSCEHMKHWWGPARYSFASCKLDFRPGGAWRIVQRGPDGEFAFRGVFKEIVAPEKIVWTFEYEGAPGDVSTETMTLVERDGRTTLTARSVFPTAAARDAMLQSGMESGARETWERLADYVQKSK